MNARSTARWLLVVALACAGFFLLGGSAFAQEETVVQNGNTSEDSTAASADVSAGNSTTMQSGPSAQDGGSSRMIGDTNTNVEQNSSATGAPVSAGSQTTSASDGAVVQNDNSSFGATATGEPVSAFNSVDAHNGPYASGPGTSAGQIGDGNLDIAQDADAVGGPAHSGSQNTDATGGAVVQNSNTCGDAVNQIACGTATAGSVDVSNVFGDSTDPDFPAPSGTGPVAVTSDTGDAATARIIGDTDAVITQSADGTSGGAWNGSQDVEADGGTVQDINTAAGGTAASGPVTSTNFAVAFVGPFAQASSTATAVQRGNASGELDMTSTATSGNAVNGSQVVGTTGDQDGALSVQNLNSSEDDVAVTGSADAGSEVLAFAGAKASAEGGAGAVADSRQIGDASFDIVTLADAASGNAWTGSQVTDASDEAAVQNDNTSSGNTSVSGNACASPTCEVDGEAGGNSLVVISGPNADSDGDLATTVQRGDTDTSVDASVSAVTGDAVTGSQEAEASDEANVQNTNSSTDDLSFSGDALSENELVAFTGAFANNELGPGSARQIGDASAGFILDATATSGDAVTGSQTTSAADDSDVQNFNTSELNTSASGLALAGNAARAITGPRAEDTDDAGGGTLDLDAVQRGDSSLLLEQSAVGTSGDATTGAQTTEATGDSAVQNDNDVINSFATSGIACAHPGCEGTIINEDLDEAVVNGGNLATIYVGANATGTDGDARSVLNGNADAELSQEAIATTGPANAGAQHTVADDSDVQNTNTVNDAVADCLTCLAVAGNAAEAFVGPYAQADGGFSANARQIGDSTLDAGDSQRAEANVGALTAGSQVTEATDSTVQNDNTADNPVAFAGDAVAWTGLGLDAFDPGNPDALLVIGAAAIAETADASAALNGDALLTADLSATANSGDATSGSQTTTLDGVDAGQNTNTSTNDIATTGSASAFAQGGGVVGPEARDTTGVQSGSDTATIDSSSSASSGDATSGSQQVTNTGVITLDADEAIGLFGFGAGDTFGATGTEGGFEWSVGGFVGAS